MSEYTPGPWEVDKKSRYQSIIAEKSSQKIAYIEWPFGNKKDISKKTKEYMANSKLIAAAPELLEAAEKVITENCDKPINGLKKLIKAADKAKGE
ncbi:MAG: hypothetical protein ACOCRO_00550 [Halanaerobiales bacterium]